jgi:hypothetical protein
MLSRLGLAGTLLLGGHTGDPAGQALQILAPWFTGAPDVARAWPRSWHLAVVLTEQLVAIARPSRSPGMNPV